MAARALEGACPPARHCELDSGTPFGESVVAYHDCPLKEVTLRQKARDGKWAITLDWTAFTGSYISTVIKLPQDAAKALCPKA